jgi:hypothetical protein
LEAAMDLSLNRLRDDDDDDNDDDDDDDDDETKRQFTNVNYFLGLGNIAVRFTCI